MQEQNIEQKEITPATIILRMTPITVITMACLFGSAGTLNWFEAWVYFALFLVFAVWLMTWLKKNNPDLLRQRMDFGKKFEKGWDKILVRLMIPNGVALFIVPGLDAMRYRWSELPLFLELFGFIGVAASFVVVFLVMKENTFLSRVVEIQKERGHTVVSTGPYRFVRHPLYVSSIVLYFSISLALGSMYGLIPAAIVSMLVIIRTMLEDRLLQRELDGYKEYVQQVKYRLIPGIW